MASQLPATPDPNLFSAVTISNLLGLTPSKQYYFVCAFSDDKGNVIDSRSHALGCKMSMFFNRRFENIAATDAWKVIVAAKNAQNVRPAGITYIARVTTGDNKQYNYIGKTTTTLDVRYPKGPASSGIERVFANFVAKDDMLDMTLYETDSPALVEGWCYTIAKNQDPVVTLVNIQDPT